MKTEARLNISISDVEVIRLLSEFGHYESAARFEELKNRRSNLSPTESKEYLQLKHQAFRLSRR